MKRTKSSILPWLRSQNVRKKNINQLCIIHGQIQCLQIPIDHYYTEPELILMDHNEEKSSQTVDLFSMLNSNNEVRNKLIFFLHTSNFMCFFPKSRLFLVEGETGMGKTLLATRIAGAWAARQNLQKFPILIFVTLGDFHGSIQQYVREELLPSYFKSEK